MEPLRIVIDSREQSPLAWAPSDAVTEIRGLSAGDYALDFDCEEIKGRESLAVRFAIERKSADDMAGTLGSGWDRFLLEMQRMETFCARIIVVEADYESFCFREINGTIDHPRHNHPMMTPSFITRRLSQLFFMNIGVWFAGNSQLAARVVLHLFRERKRIVDGL
jgi:hypothetical protein